MIEQLIDACITRYTNSFDRLATMLFNGLANVAFKMTSYVCLRNYWHFRWERCYCPPEFRPAPVYPRYLYEEVHGMTGYDELYPDANISDAAKAIIALADAFRASAFTLGIKPHSSSEPPEFFINH